MELIQTGKNANSRIQKFKRVNYRNVGIIGLGCLVLGLWPIASASAFEGVKNIWVSSSQWANSRTQETFAKDAVRLDGAENGSNEEKALAIYYWTLRTRGHGGANFNGPKGNEAYEHDVWKIAHVNSKGNCDGFARLLAEYWIAYNGGLAKVLAATKYLDGSTGVVRKINTRTIVYTSGEHSQTSLYWKDKDGVGRYHLMDSHLGFFAYTRDGSRLATPDEIASDLTLLTKPSKIPEPFFIRSDIKPTVANPLLIHPNFSSVFGSPPAYTFKNINSFSISPYSTDFDLRKGESIRKQWHHDGHYVWRLNKDKYGIGGYDDPLKHTFSDGTPKDPRNYKTMAPYFNSGGKRGIANSYHEYVPELLNGKFKEGSKSVSGLQSGTGAIGTPALLPSLVGQQGEIIYQIRNTNQIAQSFIIGEYFLKSNGTIKVDFSIDSGSTWENVTTLTQTSGGSQSFNLDIGRPRWDADQVTTYNLDDRDRSIKWTLSYFGYRYLVRFQITADQKAEDVGLVSLQFKNTMMVNHGMHPTLLPGDNIIKVWGDNLTVGSAVKVKFVWEENGVEKSKEESEAALPFVFTIHVAETDTMKVKCKYFDVIIIDASKVGIRRFSWNNQSHGKAVSFYPNPARLGSPLVFKFNGVLPNKLKVYNALGQAVKTLNPSSKVIRWNGKDQQGREVVPGQFFVRWETKRGMHAKGFALIQ